jgi:hypothetical protein
LQDSVLNLSFYYALNPDTRMVRKVASAPGAISWLRGHCTAKLLQCLSAMLLHLDSKLVASLLVPRLHQLVSELAPGWQKLRRASLITASENFKA